MKKKLLFALTVCLLAISLASTTLAAEPTLVIPTFTITAVDQGKTVTIKAVNFPANDSFKVTMGKFGAKGVGGVVIKTQNSGTGSFTATYDIPASLANQTTIAIRLQSPTSGYYSYNWFQNKDNPTPGGTPPAPTGGWGYPASGAGTIPKTLITEVTAGKDVTVKGSNFTTKDTYTVTIGKMGTKGVGGVKVGTVETNANSAFTKTFDIPAALKNEARLSIRFESKISGYYAYDWFVNKGGSSSTPPSSTPVPTAKPGGVGSPPKGAGTIPTIAFLEITKGDSVKIKATNCTTKDTYTIYLGKMGTKGVGGIKVGTQISDANGVFTGSFNIPSSLKAENRIAIRIVSSATGYYAYDWFTNKTSP